eukprot:6698739-Pyramimonas_sp.AAC.1
MEVLCNSKPAAPPMNKGVHASRASCVEGIRASSLDHGIAQEKETERVTRVLNGRQTPPGGPPDTTIAPYGADYHVSNSMQLLARDRVFRGAAA